MSRLSSAWIALTTIAGTFLSRSPLITPLNSEEPYKFGYKTATSSPSGREWSHGVIHSFLISMPKPGASDGMR